MLKLMIKNSNIVFQAHTPNMFHAQKHTRQH